MSFQLGINLIIMLCGIPMLVASRRKGPQSRTQLVFGLAFTLMGGSYFLEPVSEAGALAVEGLGVLIMLGHLVQMVAFSDPVSKEAKKD